MPCQKDSFKVLSLISVVQGNVVGYQRIKVELLKLVIYVLVWSGFLRISFDCTQGTLGFECFFNEADDILGSQLLG